MSSSSPTSTPETDVLVARYKALGRDSADPNEGESEGPDMVLRMFKASCVYLARELSAGHSVALNSPQTLVLGSDGDPNCPRPILWIDEGALRGGCLNVGDGVHLGPPKGPHRGLNVDAIDSIAALGGTELVSKFVTSFFGKASEYILTAVLKGHSVDIDFTPVGRLTIDTTSGEISFRGIEHDLANVTNQEAAERRGDSSFPAFTKYTKSVGVSFRLAESPSRKRGLHHPSAHQETFTIRHLVEEKARRLAQKLEDHQASRSLRASMSLPGLSLASGMSGERKLNAIVVGRGRLPKAMRATLLNTSFAVDQRKSPPGVSEMPPLLDVFSRTPAAPLKDCLVRPSLVAEIGSYHAPPWSMLLEMDTRPGKAGLIWSQHKAEAWNSTEAQLRMQGRLQQRLWNTLVPPDLPSDLEESSKLLKTVAHDSRLGKTLARWRVDDCTFKNILARYRIWDEALESTDDTLLRFNFYISTPSKSWGVPLDDLCPIEGEVLTRVEAKMDGQTHLWQNVDYAQRIHEMEEEVSHLANSAEGLVDQVLNGYITALRRAIVEYNLRYLFHRRRLSIPFTPSLAPAPFGANAFLVGGIMTFGGPPTDHWRRLVEHSRALLSDGRFVSSSSLCTEMIKLWFEGNYNKTTLFGLGEVDELVDIERAQFLQSQYLEAKVKYMSEEWQTRAAELISKEPALAASRGPLEDPAAEDAGVPPTPSSPGAALTATEGFPVHMPGWVAYDTDRLIEASNHLMSLMLRSIIERSCDDFTSFFESFRRGDEAPLRYPAVAEVSLDAADEPQALLLNTLLVDGNTVKLKYSPDYCQERLTRLFKDIVIAFNDMKGAASALSAEAAAQHRTSLYEVAVGEAHITSLLKRAESVVRECLDAAATVLGMYVTVWLLGIAKTSTIRYKPHLSLLTEVGRAHKTAALVEQIPDLLGEEEDNTPSAKVDASSIIEYIRKLREAKRNVLDNCLPMLRTALMATDCSEVNELLCQQASQCIDIVMSALIERIEDRSRKFTSAVEVLEARFKEVPKTEQALVDLEKELDDFDENGQAVYEDEYKDIRHWLNVLFDCDYSASAETLRLVHEAGVRLSAISDMIPERIEQVEFTRDDIEQALGERRDKTVAELEMFKTVIARFADYGDVNTADDNCDRLDTLKAKMQKYVDRREEINSLEGLLGMDITEFEIVEECQAELEVYDKLWNLVREYGLKKHAWYKGAMFQLDAEGVETETMTMWRSAYKLQATFEQDGRKVPMKAATFVKSGLDEVKKHLPLLQALCNPGLRGRHWAEISSVVGFTIAKDKTTTLQKMLDLDMGAYSKDLADVSDRASQEYQIERSLESQQTEWQPVTCEFKPWKETGSFILSGATVDEVQGLIDDHIIKTQTMKGSPSAQPFAERITDWEQFLMQATSVIEVWVKVQGVWLYLEPIFGSEDIMKQIPTEGALFKEVDTAWRDMMERSKEAPAALEVFKQEGILEMLEKSQEQLERVQKGLNDYLESKRLKFPRFFFLSNDELLEILSETKDPVRVQPHLRKAFEGIQALDFEDDKKITAMLSVEKERIALKRVVDPMLARGNVELWLVELEEMMLETIRAVIFDSIADYPTKSYAEWLALWPGQVVIAVGNIFWTSEVMAALTSEGNVGLGKYFQQMDNLLQDIVALVRGDIPRLVRCTLEALVVIFVHNKDTVQELHGKGLSSIDDFDWLVQLRYFVEKNADKKGDVDDVFVRISNSHLGYGYEALGNSSRLIITPLTDRCYRTLCGALHLQYGGAPEGPAGTGKTETVKDLAKALARMCVVFNCSDGLDYIAMGKFFKGLAATGGWCCFDEFNRIDLEVLSVVAQQILTIQTAIKARLTEFEFEGCILPIKWTCNSFITMNPGYAGRSDLPDNLKALFRTVAMMVPDYAMIAEIKLYSFGFEDSRSLARKIVTTYKLCSEQLSSQSHYDYGMRAVFSVLVAAGNLKRKYGTESESVLMLRAINDVNLAKFLAFDVPLFRGITSDLFPGVELPQPDYRALISKLRMHFEKNNLEWIDYLIDKIIQFYECHIVRHSVMLVGLPFSGKTTALNILQAALTDLAESGEMHKGQIVHQARLNPKSIPAGCLYGDFDEVSHEWTDGIVAVLFRNFAKNQTDERKWLVFDGPVDAVWIENMNTVMDENKKLCLNSGEIIAMSSNMRTIFEPMDVEVASPATISRNGMVYFEPHILGYEHLIKKSFKEDLPPTFDSTKVDEADGMQKWLVPPLLHTLKRECSEVSPSQEQNWVQSYLRLFSTLLKPLHDSQEYEGKGVSTVTNIIDCLTVFSIIWSLGAACTTESRKIFDAELRKLLKHEVEEIEHFKKIEPTLPERGSVYDYFFDVKQCKWLPWGDTVTAEQQFPAGASPESIIVRTLDNIRYSFIANHCIDNRIPLLFCGPTGTGKTAYMQGAILSRDKSTTVPIFLGFSAQTQCAQTQDQVDVKLDRRRKDTYGPPTGKLCIVMVDDLNMPSKEAYGAQPPIEIMRQLIDQGGWFDRKDSTHPFRHVIDTLVVTAMGPPGGGRTFITPRFTQLMLLTGFALLDDDNMTRIFSTILDWRFQSQSYPAEVKGLSEKLVSATLEVYKAVASELLPTPLKVHYTFNLRDFAKVMFGVLLLPKDQCDGTNRHVRLWVHEVFRVFGDRLVDEKDRVWLLDQMRDVTRSHLGVSFDEVMKHLDSNGDNKVDTLDEIRLLFFGDLLSAPAAPKRPYAECPDFNGLAKQVTSHLEQYNMMSTSPLNLVLFLYCIEHLSRVARVLKQPGGHSLMVGVGGSGRQSVTKLAAFMADYTIFQIEIAKGYDKLAWRDDLKKLLMGAGSRQEPMVFLFTDTQIKDESFVEDINNMLNTGEVPNLFAPDEKMQCCESVRGYAKSEGKATDGTPTSLFAYFLERIRGMLHIVLCFSPIGNGWRSRLRQFPSLVNCTTIDWFSEWPSDALLSVAEQFLEAVPMADSTRASCVEMCQLFHVESTKLATRFKLELRRHYYATPTSYLELINTFKTLLDEKRGEVSAKRDRYLVGLEKLANTEQSVAGMQKELTDLQPQLVAKNKEVEEMMSVVNAESEKTNAVKEVVSGEEAIASEAADRANAIKTDCEKELGEAMPELNEALSALDTLTGKDIAEIKAMTNPPEPVRLVLTAVCIMKGIGAVKVQDKDTGKKVDDYWPNAKKMVSEMGFLQSLKDYDKDNIPAAVINKIKDYTVKDDFQPARVAKVSKAAYGICCWVRAMETYDRVAKIVAPKREALAAAEAEYATVMVGLNEKRAELQKVLDELQALNDKLDALETEQMNLKNQVEDCSRKLERAEQLITSLGGEKTRWTAMAEQLGYDYDNLTGDVILASGVIAYLGAFTPEFRRDAVSAWSSISQSKEIPGSAEFALERCLGEPVKIRSWTIAGLPNDAFSIENGIIVDKARRWPLCIDPQGQANKWIKNTEKDHKLVTCKFTDGDYLRRLEGCIQFGYPFLIENVLEDMDPAIEPLLLKQTFTKGGMTMMKLGDATIEYNKKFRLYLTSKLRNPHYLPEVSVKVTLLNFMITPVGLEDQLLNLVVSMEKPDLAAEKARVILEGAENKKQLEEIEDKILKVLSSSQGNILEDETAIQVLSASKVLSNEIAEKQSEAEQTELRIDKARNCYVPVAEQASILFFCIADLAQIDPMYQYSLPFFVSLYEMCIRKAPDAQNLADRIEILNDYFMQTLYNNICRSLFEKHKLLMSFQLCCALKESRNELPMRDYRFLLTGGVSMEDPPPKAAPWIPDRCWGELFKMSRLGDPYTNILEAFSQEQDLWKSAYDHSDPLKRILELGSALKAVEGFTEFQRLMVLRCLRADKLVPAIMDFVSNNLGESFVTPPPFDLSSSYADSSNVTPLIFVLSPGSDPFAALSKFAGDQNVEFKSISLGQGQGPRAEQMIEAGMREGSWVVLQNCHLCTSWMPKLERILETMDPKHTHRNYRLWLTSYPSPQFPVAILQNGVKMTNEPPKGLRSNLMGSFLTDPICDPEFFNDKCVKPWHFKKLLYSLCFFHAVIQERRLFGPLGWNIPYEFTESDMRISVLQLQMFINEYASGEVPFKALNYLTGECNYGGRVTDDKDRRLIMTLLADYFTEDVFNDEYCYTPECPQYRPPDGNGSYDDFLEAIRGLPAITDPRVFGFHPNANLTKEQNEAFDLMKAVLQMGSQSGGTAGGSMSPEEVVGAISADILQRMPMPWRVEDVQEAFPMTYTESMNTVLAQELTRYNGLIKVIRESLADIQKAVKGLILMSPQLEAAFHSINDGRTPEMWMAKSYPSLKPLGSYTNDLIERLRNFQSWIDGGKTPHLFWFSGFFFTQAFTTGALQNYARKYTIPIDTVDFDFEVVKGTPSEAPEDGVYIHGLFLEGCRWSEEEWTLTESDPKVLFVEAPRLWLKPMVGSDMNLDYPHYNCPLYKISSRRGVLATTGHSTNFVMYMRLPSNTSEAHWIKRGVAMLTQLDS